MFAPFSFDTVRKAFGVIPKEGGGVIGPSRLLLEEPVVSLQSMQGLVLWAAQKAQWSVRCGVKYLELRPSLDDFVARWQTVLEVWRAQKDMTVSRKDLSYLIEQ